VLLTSKFCPLTLSTSTANAATTSASVNVQCPYRLTVIGVWSNHRVKKGSRLR
jgi:hypothetical protein